MNNSRVSAEGHESAPSAQMGIVAIGRNEGERLRRCLMSICKRAYPVVYVDSGSTDGSVDLARSMGAEVVELDHSVPFTAARARNAGVGRLLELHPAIPYVHFLDGDCEVLDGWFDAALTCIEGDDTIAAVWGLLIERYPERTIYNRLTDLEWRYSWPCGETRYCGGIALMRLAAYADAGKFNENLIAGEEPELCYRIRRGGSRIYRLRREMALHDVAMTRFGQWWTRSVRGGYCYAEGAWMYGREPERYNVRECVSIVAWAVILPVLILLLALLVTPWGLLLSAAYALFVVRMTRHVLSKGMPVWHAVLYGSSCLLAKFAHLQGVLTFLWRKSRASRPALVEYK